MFTGLIQDVGVVESVTPGAVTELWLKSHFPEGDFLRGESIACDGVCLTVVEWRGGSYRVQAAPETLRRTTLGGWTAGRKVSLEKALKVGDRLGGHWVQGHVDGVGTLLEVGQDGGTRVLRCALPEALSPFFVEKGSVCMDGVSLTLTAVTPSDFSVMLIPETVAKTALGGKRAGDAINLEADIVGKYVARMMGPRGGLTLAQLQAAGLA